MAGEWWEVGLLVFALRTLHQQALSSSRGGQGDGYHSLHSSTRGFCLDHLTHAGVGSVLPSLADYWWVDLFFLTQGVVLLFLRSR